MIDIEAMRRFVIEHRIKQRHLARIPSGDGRESAKHFWIMLPECGICGSLSAGQLRLQKTAALSD